MQDSFNCLDPGSYAIKKRGIKIPRTHENKSNQSHTMVYGDKFFRR